MVLRNLSYTQDGTPDARLDVYLPSAPAPQGGWPVILAIHGGGWRRFGKSPYGRRIASSFVPRGYAVIAPNYLLSEPGRPSWPVNVGQLQQALGWIGSNSGRFGLDSGRIATMGESAGGNLAIILATLPVPSGTPEVGAVVGFSSPTDMITLYRQSPTAGAAESQYLGGPPASIPQRYADASPVTRVTADSPPMMLIHGSRDDLVPASQSRELAGILSRKGVTNRLLLVPGGHDLNFPVNTPDNLLPQILAFLSAAWKDN